MYVVRTVIRQDQIEDEEKELKSLKKDEGMRIELHARAEEGAEARQET
jgi:hypothetical protein